MTNEPNEPGDGEIRFHLYREGDESDTIVLIGESEMTLGEFKQARNRFKRQGYRLIVNGEEQSVESQTVQGILSDLNTSGISIYISGSKATDDTPIRTGSRVTTAGEVKGNAVRA